MQEIPGNNYSSDIPHDGGAGDEDEVPAFTCQFCGVYDETFTEDGLDLHYWKDCPMLAACGQCGQVIEVSCLNEHLLTECEMQVQLASTFPSAAKSLMASSS